MRHIYAPYDISVQETRKRQTSKPAKSFPTQTWHLLVAVDPISRQGGQTTCTEYSRIFLDRESKQCASNILEYSTIFLDREGRQCASNIPATPILAEFQLIAPKTGRSSTNKRILISIQGLLHMSTFWFSHLRRVVGGGGGPGELAWGSTREPNSSHVPRISPLPSTRLVPWLVKEPSFL